MALTGRFGDTTGRPYIEGRIFLPRFNVAGDVSFLIDTGADTSLLHPADAQRLNLDFAALTGTRESQGVGGITTNFEERVILAFTDEGVAVHAYNLALSIARFDPDSPDLDLLRLPSLLGRDILDYWCMTYDPQHHSLTMEVVSADQTFPLR